MMYIRDDAPDPQDVARRLGRMDGPRAAARRQRVVDLSQHGPAGELDPEHHALAGGMVAVGGADAARRLAGAQVPGRG